MDLKITNCIIVLGPKLAIRNLKMTSKMFHISEGGVDPCEAESLVIYTYTLYGILADFSGFYYTLVNRDWLKQTRYNEPCCTHFH